MRHALNALMLAVSCLTTGSLSADEVVWQIGKKDRDFGEFAPTNDPAQYAPRFANDILFEIGKSDPKEAFSALLPGPEDAWAGRRRHTATIKFDLQGAPSGTYLLELLLVDTHSQRPPKLEVAINGTSTQWQLERGTGDLSLNRPDKGQPQTLSLVVPEQLLKGKENVVTIQNISGSWLLFDAVTLSRAAAGQVLDVTMSLEPTLFYIERDGRFLQEILLQAKGLIGQQPVKIEVREGVDLLDTIELGKPVLGFLSDAIHVPGVRAPRQLNITLTCGEQTALTSITQQATKLWRIYCAPSTHTDIGYTDIQDKVIELHNRNTDLALELIHDFPLYHWNLESAWAAQMWLRDRPPYRHEEIYEASRQARLGIESSYLNMLTGLCSGEELIRNLYYSARLHREFGVPFKSHTLTDAPSHVWTVPTVLANAGIKYLSCGVNQTRAPLFKKDIHKKSPFWWEGPDGSRILTWFTAGYSQAGRIGLKDGVDRMRTAIQADLYQWWQREDYPFDAILLHGAYTDNVYIGRSIAESITAYSEKYAYPKVILCSNDVFFEYIEENFPDKIQTVRGCGGSWWEDGAGSTAFETGLNRNTHEDIVAAETVWATVAGVDQASAVPQNEFNTIWDLILLYDEHTWGAYNSISEPNTDFVHRQWAIKAAYSTDAADMTKRLLDSGLQKLVARVNVADNSLLVFNPTGRSRTDVVYAEIPRTAVVMDGDTPVPQQIATEDTALKNVTVAFVAQDVPAVGYRTYRIAPNAEKPAPLPAAAAADVLENKHYRVTFDKKTGAIASIVDKALNKELVDSASPYKLGQLIYALGGSDKGRTQVECPNVAEIEFKMSEGGEMKPAANGPVYTSVKAGARLHLFKTLEMETVLFEDQRRIDFVFRMHKDLTHDKEAIYIAFPFAGANPKFRYEIADGSVPPNEDHIPGGCRDWFSIQRWVTVNTDDAGVAWSPVDTPLITLCDMTPGKWLDELPITNGTIFAYVMNNYWFTNYKAGQDGWFTFRYSITSDKSIDAHAATLFGEQVQAPMRTAFVPPGRTGEKTLAAKQGFCQVEPANVMLNTFKPADDGNGMIVRLREISGKDTDATIRLALPGIGSAARCDLVERDLGPLPIKDGAITYKLPANGLATIRVK